MALDDAEVRISFKDLTALQRNARDLQSRVQDLEVELEHALLQSSDRHAESLLTAFQAALQVVQFAVGNLDPTTVCGWPYEALRATAEAIAETPTLRLDPDMQALVVDFRDFAGIAQGLEEQRRLRDAQRVVTPATAADFGPRTAAAAFVHEARTYPTSERDDG